MTKIRFSKKRMLVNVYFAISWIVLAAYFYVLYNKTKPILYVCITMSILYFVFYLYELKMQYLTIGNGTVRKNSFFPKRILLSEILEIKKMGSTTYLLITPRKTLIIYTDFIAKDSLSKLNEILNLIEVKNKKLEESH
ncbi:MAG: hypothetical protein AAF348_14430 [Bacteroidota bacterium]